MKICTNALPTEIDMRGEYSLNVGASLYIVFSLALSLLSRMATIKWTHAILLSRYFVMGSLDAALIMPLNHNTHLQSTIQKFTPFENILKK